MASISSLTSSSSSSIYGSRSSNIISGLASGLDTESLIEGMVQGIKSKIDSQKQQQTILGWKQEAYRSISDQLVSLSTKYTSYTSSTNLMSSAFFTPSTITSLGKYADKISATGSTTSDIEVLGVKNLAQTETITFEGLNGVENSKQIVGSNSIDLTGEVDVSKIAGKSLVMEYGNESFTITFDSNKSYDSIDDVVEEINTQLKSKSVSTSDGGSIDISTKLEAVKDGDRLVFKYKNDNDSNTVTINKSSSSSVLDALGLSEGEIMTSNDSPITSNNITKESLYSKQDAKDVLAGASITITYNGEKKTITMPDVDSDEYNKIFGDDISSTEAATNMQKYLQDQVDKAFGYGRVTVSNGATEDGKFTPKFEVQGEDTISVDSGTTNVIGAGGIFGIERGASNRVNTSKTLEDLLGDKLDNWTSVKTDDNGDELYALEINGVKIGEYTKDTTLSTIMNDINNNSDAGVNVKYSSTANQFVFTSTYGGAGGRIAINDTTKDDTKQYTNIAAELFGSIQYDDSGVSITTKSEDGSEQTIKAVKTENADGSYSTIIQDSDGNQISDSPINVIRGQDATIEVSINGTKKTLTSGTNTFNIDGFSITANGVFEATEASDAVTFNKTVDADKIVDAIKTFVEEYNKMLDDLGTAYTTQPDNDYTALTDDQKAEMTDKQIEEYETKAKEGLLFADSDLKSLASELRFLFSGSDMSNIGITTSSDAAERGKLSLDEDKLREAINGDLESVKDAFTSSIQKDENGNVVSGGVMPKLKEVLDKYAATTGAVKGILIEKAGSQFSPTALLNNTISSEIDDIDEEIDKLTDQLNDKIDFYTSKFTQLEVLISQMNSQSSYLSSLSSGY